MTIALLLWHQYSLGLVDIDRYLNQLSGAGQNGPGLTQVLTMWRDGQGGMEVMQPGAGWCRDSGYFPG